MVSPTVNVVRYTALFSGIFYGIIHHRTLQKTHDREKQNHAVHERQRLIIEAKETWKKKQQKEVDTVTIINDPDDPRFDLEALIARWESDSK